MNGRTGTDIRPVTSSSHAAALPAPSAQHDGSGSPAICRCACRAPQAVHLSEKLQLPPCEVRGHISGMRCVGVPRLQHRSCHLVQL